MGANLKTAFVVDVESTCWNTKEEQGSKPNEIIEIGIVSIDLQTWKVSSPVSYLVAPRFSEVSKFCEELTGWTAEAIAGGGTMEATFAAIQSEFQMSSGHVWFSCGEYDRNKLSSYGPGSVGDLYGIAAVDNPFDRMRSHVNIKTLFAIKHFLRKEVGMAQMLSMINKPLEGRHHNGGDDAWNIAKLVRHVLS